ncbi:hypothetical protein SAMN06265379_102179 [Saccharicrinis carchari]|uniref:Endonuclease/Exonuclease/phosphatase family protein n=1 Tax=Saccharicrinis carchari TaxID=1168039 RepID=A0A521BX81_SACCC|nr:hypothetical protein SAMN06265379_102179 [Saccharicrinis carchari]
MKKESVLLVTILLLLSPYVASKGTSFKSDHNPGHKAELRILTMNVLNSKMHEGWNDTGWNGAGCSRGEQVVKVMIKTKADIICV